MTWQERIRELVGPGVLIAALGAGVVSAGSPAAGTDVIRVGAFNIQVFGDTKVSHPEIMDVLARVALSPVVERPDRALTPRLQLAGGIPKGGSP